MKEGGLSGCAFAMEGVIGGIVDNDRLSQAG